MLTHHVSAYFGGRHNPSRTIIFACKFCFGQVNEVICVKQALLDIHAGFGMTKLINRRSKVSLGLDHCVYTSQGSTTQSKPSQHILRVPSLCKETLAGGGEGEGGGVRTMHTPQEGEMEGRGVRFRARTMHTQQEREREGRGGGVGS